LLRLSKLRKEYLIDIEDAVVVVRDEDGKVHLKQGINLVTAGATTGFVSGSLWGTLVGFLFLNPVGRARTWQRDWRRCGRSVRLPVRLRHQ
jgi:uncharacterized membrane protein